MGRVIDAATNHKLRRNTNWHIRKDIGVAGFFAELDKRNIRYLVLRWFDDLPEVERGHDIDILVEDTAVGHMQDLLTLWPGGQSIDIYSETGAGGFAVKPYTPHEMSAFPPHLSSELLANTIRINDGYSVPDTRHHFLCLAYHAIYMKAQDSGLRSKYSDLPKGKTPSHEYSSILSHLGRQAGFSISDDPSLEELDEILNSVGWRPPQDTLDRIGVWSPWVARHFCNTRAPADVPDGLTVFFIRKRACEAGLKDQIRKLLDAHGFEVIASRDLDDAAQDAAARSFRGGNWGKGPYPLSGGPPQTIFAAIDVFPQTVAGKDQRAQPLLNNQRILGAKSSVRDFVFRTYEGPRFNAMHSTDNAGQALETLQILFPDCWNYIVGQAQAAVAAVDHPPDPLRILPGNQRRARVEVIEHEGEPAVRKVFRRNKTEFLSTEVNALQALSGSPHVPKCLHHDARSLTLEYIEDDWQGTPPSPLPIAQVQQLASLMRLCGEIGYDPIDLMPGKNLICHKGKITALDFEFCFSRQSAVEPERLYALAGVPAGFSGPLPIDTPSIRDPYRSKWYPYTGMDLQTFLYGTANAQAAAWKRNVLKIRTRQFVLSRMKRNRVGRLALRQLKKRMGK